MFYERNMERSMSLRSSCNLLMQFSNKEIRICKAQIGLQMMDY